jgi:broad specificity phosphatase PhoE/predicted kinase
MHPSADNQKIALVMVGLPARGKTYIARKLARYLSWLGHRTQVFNVGNYRRERLGSHQSHEFFDPDNAPGRAARADMARAALEDMLAWFGTGGEVGIYDATNSTRDRRQRVLERCRRDGVQVLFIESICDDPAIIESNVRETKLLSPDYAGADPDVAVRDFRARIAHYERAYEPIDDQALSFIQLVDVGRRVVVNRVRGYLPGRLVFFLTNLHVTPRAIWLTRHGESVFNVAGRIGGDSDLSPRGDQYARSLAGWLDTWGRAEERVTVWTSALTRAIQTAQYLSVPSKPWRALDEINAGMCDGMTYAEIAAQLPNEFAARSADKLRYRYPRGESYQDVVQRLEPVIIEIEREQEPVLVIAHQAVLRALYAYFMDRSPEECPRLDIPLHTVIELTPKAYGCQERRIPLLPQVRGRDS